MSKKPIGRDDTKVSLVWGLYRDRLYRRQIWSKIWVESWSKKFGYWFSALPVTVLAKNKTLEVSRHSLDMRKHRLINLLAQKFVLKILPVGSGGRFWEGSDTK